MLRTHDKNLGRTFPTTSSSVFGRFARGGGKKEKEEEGEDDDGNVEEASTHLLEAFIQHEIISTQLLLCVWARQKLTAP